MSIENANTRTMSAVLAELKDNEDNISHLAPVIGQYLRDSGSSHTVGDVARWVENMLGKSPSVKNITIPLDKNKPSSLAIKSIHPITHQGLRQYFKRRKIPPSIIEKYANQAWIYNHNTAKCFAALTFKNESGGDEIINQHISCTSSKSDITFIRGSVYKPDGLHVFKSILDFFALLSYKKVDQLKEDSIILNSWSNLSKITPYIKGYGYKFVCCWLEHTKTGIAATRSVSVFIETEIGTRFLNMVAVYKQHISLFNWYLNYSDNPSS